MNVILIRHAEAGDRNPAQYPDDDLRPVTADGRRKMTAIAEAMKKMGVKFDVMITSPLVRAAQTADIVREVYQFIEPVLVSDALGHACTPENVLKLLAEQAADARVALVGHEPAFSQVAGAMISQSGYVQIELKKGGSIGIGFEDPPKLGKGTLQFQLKPGHLKRLKR